MTLVKNGCLASTVLAICMISGNAVAADAPGAPAIAPAPAVKDDGTLTVPSFELPFSSFASHEAAESFVRRLRSPMPIVSDIVKMRVNRPVLRRELGDEAGQES